MKPEIPLSFFTDIYQNQCLGEILFVICIPIHRIFERMLALFVSILVKSGA